MAPVTQGIKSEHGEVEKPLLQKKIIYNNLFEIEDALYRVWSDNNVIFEFCPDCFLKYSISCIVYRSCGLIEN